MISQTELLTLMADLESDRVERTISTSDTTKFREAICAFSNDFPNHQQPGYLLIGVEDKSGKASGLSASDALLRHIADLRQDGEILPQPAMSVGRITLSDGSGDVVVVESTSLRPAARALQGPRSHSRGAPPRPGQRKRGANALGAAHRDRPHL